MDLDTLGERVLAEMREHRVVTMITPVVDAWARKP
jgi:hypothetical protein